jgi:hypothetical protein
MQINYRGTCFVMGEVGGLNNTWVDGGLKLYIRGSIQIIYGGGAQVIYGGSSNIWGSKVI